VENLVLVKEETNGRKLLRNDNQEVRDFLEGSKIYAEPNSGDDKSPLSFEEIDRVKNTSEVLFTNADEKEYKHKITVDKRITVLELKQIIEKAINLSIDEFKVYKVTGDSYKTELRTEEDKLSEHFHYPPVKLAIERGKPLRKGEIPCKWILYDLIKDSREDLFELALPGKLTVKEVKAELIKHWKELQANEPGKRKDLLPDDPSLLRLRNLYTTSLSTIHMDHKQLKDITSRFYNYANDIFVQVLPEGKTETKTSDEIVVLVLRQFHPDRYELSPPIEFDANKDEKLGEFRDRISKLAGISPSSLALASVESCDIQKILRIPTHLKWIPRPDDDTEHHSKYARYSTYDTYDTNRLVRSLNLSDGNMLLYRDLSVPLKQLTEEEEKKIKEEEEAKRQAKIRQQYSSRKEERLDIKIADVSISDGPRTTKKQ